jgi:hypothetical protein
LPTAAQVSGTAPAPVQAFGALPSVTPTYANAATVDPAQSGQYMDEYAGLLGTALGPEFAQQQSQLQDSDAARGISNSGAASYLQGNLEGQQAAAYAGALEPIVSQGYSYSQADTAANQANTQQANITNAGAANAATGTNAAYYASALGTNESDYNNYLNELFGAGTSESGSELSAYLNSFGPNTGVTSAITTGEQSQGNIYGNIYGTAQQGASSNLNSALSAYGEIAAAGA